jgi:alkanesulfonate monooxygenase SsuD/methylene tetrahydromethanopterin reductase-like flavin-dependent oxidoreductase (luciferase family)
VIAMEKRPATAAQVRAWARRNGLRVGSRGHMPAEVYRKYNARHQAQQATNRNPSIVKETSDD